MTKREVPQGIDYAPDGTLFALAGGALWQVDAFSGTGVLYATGINGVADIDVSDDYSLRLVTPSGQIQKVNLRNGSLTASGFYLRTTGAVAYR